MPRIIEEPDLIGCEYAAKKGWPSTFRLGAQICVVCDQLQCRFHRASPDPTSKTQGTAIKRMARNPAQPRRIRFNNPMVQPQELTTREVLSRFPSRSLRPYQKETVERIVEAFNSGKKCVILTAPTGFGKSYVNTSFTSATRSFYATPQLALVDQMLRDQSLNDRFVEIKGRRNYPCYHIPRRSVHLGRCVTEEYGCKERFDVCRHCTARILCRVTASTL